MKHISGGATYVLPPCFKWSRCMIFQVMLWFLVLLAHAPHQALSLRNMTYIEEFTPLPVWNKTLEKTEGKCHNFHADQLPTLFFYWPEDNPLFHHCCTEAWKDTSNSSQVPQYKYSQYGPQLAYATYRDLGFFDQCLPFWKCHSTYSKIFETSIYIATCERTDLTSLYKNRFWRLTILKYSLLETILPWISILEVVVVLMAVAIFPLTWRSAKVIRKGWNYLVPTSKKWLRSIWKRLLMDWTHMLLLAMIGNGLMEAMRRQSLYSMQSKTFFDYSMLYLLLSLILSAASTLQQVAYWIGCAIGEIGPHRDDAQQDVDHTDIEQSRGAGDIQLGSVGAQQHNGLVISSLKESFTKKEHLDGVELKTYNRDAPQAHDLNSQTEITDEEQSKGGEPQEEVLIQVDQSIFSGPFSYKILEKPKENNEKLSRSVHIFSLGDDYKWQPLAAQTAILFAIGSFLTNAIDNYDDQGSEMWGLVLGFIVQVGSLWTGLYAVVVFCQRATYIIKFLWKLRDVANNSGRTGPTNTIDIDKPL